MFTQHLAFSQKLQDSYMKQTKMLQAIPLLRNKAIKRTRLKDDPVLELSDRDLKITGIKVLKGKQHE